MQKREFTDLDDLRLVYRGNKILLDLFQKNVHSIRQVCSTDSEAKGFYRFLKNDRVSEEDIISNMLNNCRSACADKYVICIHKTQQR
ncbi:MAG: transposase DNA-binding-containing protein [Bacteroidota bacterium]|nr:transposase DNA-binding-containing protein [Bacteroidota bacterium]